MPERSRARLSLEKKEKKKGKIATDKIDRGFAVKYAGEFSDNSFINRSRYGGCDIDSVSRVLSACLFIWQSCLFSHP